MKKSFMTRVLAMGLSTAMAFSVPVVGNFTTAFADTAASSSAALAMSYTQKDAEVGTRMVFSLKGSQASKWKVVRAASSDKAVAAISKTTSKKVAVEAQGAGEAKISVRVQKTKDKRQKVLKIRLNITAADPTIASVEQTDAAKLVVTLSKPVESVAAADFAIAKNDEAKTAVAVKSATLDETDKTKVTIETEKGMTDGQVYTVTYTAATEDKTVSTAEFTAQTATVLGLASVAQATTTKLTATFNGEVASAKAADFSLVRDDNKVIAIKSVAVDAKDKTKVTVETYDAMNDAKVYTLTYTAKAENGESVPSTAQFTATDGKIADVGLDKTTVTAGEAEEFKVQTLASGNVVLNECLYSQVSSNNLEVTVTPSGAGYMDGDKLYLPNVNDTANVRVTYHTFKYEGGVETGTITKDFVITAVAADKTLAGFDYSIVDSGKKPAWDLASYKQNTRIAVDDSDKMVYFRFKNASGTDKTSDYTVETSDDNKIVISGNPEDGCGILGVSEGTAYILVKDKATNSVVATLPVTVIAKRVASKLVLGSNSVTVSTASGIAEEKVSLKVNDQYGDKVGIDTVTIDASSIGLKDNDKKAVTYDKTSSAIVISGAAISGSAIGKKVKLTVTTKDKNKTQLEGVLSVTAKAPVTNKAASYEIVVDGNKDITVGDTDTEAKELKVYVAEKYEGITYKYTTMSSITITSLTGSMSTTTGAIATTDSAISGKVTMVSKSDDTFSKSISKGRYKLTVEYVDKYSKKQSKDINIDVTDSQVVPSVSVLSKDAENSSLESLFKNDAKVKYYCNGTELSGDDIKYVECQSTFPGTSTTCVVKTVTVSYKVGGSVYLTVTLPVNTTFVNVLQ